MNTHEDRLEKMRQIFPEWNEDKDCTPVLDPLDLAKRIQIFAKEVYGLDVPLPTNEEAKAALIAFSKERGLKQPIFIERD